MGSRSGGLTGLLVLALVSAPARGTDGADAPASPALAPDAVTAVTCTVQVRNVSFSPATCQIAAGESVRWTWVAGVHSTTSGTCSGGDCTPDGTWDSGTKTSGSFTFTFDTAGTYDYFCTVHGAMMKGTVNVSGPKPLEASASATPSCGVAPLSVAFTGGATGGKPPYTFLWDFGDGTVGSAEQSPVHQYAAGSWTAMLQVADSDIPPATDSAIVGIRSSDVPVAIVQKVKLLTDPLRLKLSGTGFPTDCTIRIGDVAAPKSTCASATRAIAGKGKALKQLLPKGQSVVVTIVDNGSGAVSCPASFRR